MATNKIPKTLEFKTEIVEKIDSKVFIRELAWAVREYIWDNYFEELTSDECEKLIPFKFIELKVKERALSIFNELQNENRKSSSYDSDFWSSLHDSEEQIKIAKEIVKIKNKEYKPYLASLNLRRIKAELKALRDKAEKLGYKLVKEDTNDNKKQNKTPKTTKPKKSS